MLDSYNLSSITLNTIACSIVRVNPKRNAYITAGYKSAMDGKRPSLTSWSIELMSTLSGISHSYADGNCSIRCATSMVTLHTAQYFQVDGFSRAGIFIVSIPLFVDVTC